MSSFLSTKNTGNSSAILARIASADKSAVDECVKLYGKMIWALAKQYTDSPADAELAVPQIFLDIWQNAAACDLTVSDEAVWIALIARRRLSACMLVEDFQPPAETTKTEEIDFQPLPEVQQGIFGNGFGKIHKQIAVAQ